MKHKKERKIPQAPMFLILTIVCVYFYCPIANLGAGAMRWKSTPLSARRKYTNRNTCRLPNQYSTLIIPLLVVLSSSSSLFTTAAERSYLYIESVCVALVSLAHNIPLPAISTRKWWAPLRLFNITNVINFFHVLIFFSFFFAKHFNTRLRCGIKFRYTPGCA